MVDINLHQAAENDLRINKQKSIIKSGPFISFTLLATVAVAYVVTFTYKETLLKKKDDLIATRQAQLASLDNAVLNKIVASLDNAVLNKIVDFQYSVDNISYNLKNKKDSVVILEQVEKYMIKGSYLNSLEYDTVKNILTMEVVSESFRAAASQILNLKNSELFKDVRVTDSSRNQDNQAVFKIEAYYSN